MTSLLAVYQYNKSFTTKIAPDNDNVVTFPCTWVLSLYWFVSNVLTAHFLAPVLTWCTPMYLQLIYPCTSTDVVYSNVLTAHLSLHQYWRGVLQCTNSSFILAPVLTWCTPSLPSSTWLAANVLRRLGPLDRGLEKAYSLIRVCSHWEMLSLYWPQGKRNTFHTDRVNSLGCFKVTNSFFIHALCYQRNNLFLFENTD